MEVYLMFVDKKKMAEILDISVSMVNKLLAKGMPHTKVGKAVRFEPELVIAWIKERSK